jgi:hypothetical protein
LRGSEQGLFSEINGTRVESKGQEQGLRARLESKGARVVRAREQGLRARVQGKD